MTTTYECGDCDWTGTEAQMHLIPDVEDRVLSGELMATGTCPRCHSLIGVADEDVPDYTLKACARIMRARGWKVEEPS